MKHIFVITPVVEREGLTAEKFTAETLAPLETAELKIHSLFIDEGPLFIERHLDEALAVPGMVRKAREAQAMGADGILVDCMADPGVDVLRECVSVPVIGSAATAFHTAALLGHRFAILTPTQGSVPWCQQQVEQAGLNSRCACVLGVETPIQAIGQDEEATISSLADNAKKAIVEHGADTIILGCACYSPYAEKLQQTLSKQGLDVLVINPTTNAIYTLEAIIKSNLCHSKRLYPSHSEMG